MYRSTHRWVTSIQAREPEAMTNFNQRQLELEVLHIPEKSGFRVSHLGLPRTPASWIWIKLPSAAALTHLWITKHTKHHATVCLVGLKLQLRDNRTVYQHHCPARPLQISWDYFLACLLGFWGGIGVGSSPGEAVKWGKARRRVHFSFASPI